MLGLGTHGRANARICRGPVPTCIGNWCGCFRNRPIFFFFAIYIKGVLSVKYSNGAVYLGEVEMVYYLARIYY
jgi:hypothetical protein